MRFQNTDSKVVVISSSNMMLCNDSDSQMFKQLHNHTRSATSGGWYDVYSLNSLKNKS